MALKAVLFDFDGTLVDSEPIHYEIWRQVLGRYGHPLSPQTYRDELAGIPTIDNAALLVQRLGLPVSAIDLSNRKNAAVGEYLAQHSYPLMPQVRESLARLARPGVRLAVVTGSTPDHVLAALDTLGLRASFSAVLSGAEAARNKPYPDVYLAALEHLGLGAHDCIAIEDTEHGLAAASGAGIRCIAIPNEVSARQDFSRASHVAANMAAAIDYILALEAA